MWRLEKRKVMIWKKDYRDSYTLAFIDMQARWLKVAVEKRGMLF
jgi:hypothetical protein